MPKTTPLPASKATRPLPFGPLDGLLALVTVAWGLNSVAIKYAIGRFHPMVFNSIRFAYATALIFAVMWSTEGRRGGLRSIALPRRDVARVAAIGLVGHFVYQFLWMTGIDLSSAGNTAFIMAVSPVSIAVLSSLFGHDRLNLAAWTGIALSLGGVIIVAVGAENSLSFRAASVHGDMMTLLAVFCWAVYTITSKPLLDGGSNGADRYSPIRLTAWTMLFGTIALVTATIPAFPRQDWSAVTPLAWGCLVYSGAFGLVGPYIVWNYGLERLGPARTGAYHNLTPITTGVFAFLLLGERWTPLRFAGVAIILAGVTIVRRAKTASMASGSGRLVIGPGAPTR